MTTSLHAPALIHRHHQGPMAKAKSRSAPQNRKLIGTRTEAVTQNLTPAEVAVVRAQVCDLLRDLDKLEEERKTLTAGVRSRLADKKAALKESTTVAATARKDAEVTIEEWLTDGNEVLRIRTDTGEVIGRRTARIDELQEDLPLVSGEPDDPFGGDDDA